MSANGDGRNEKQHELNEDLEATLARIGIIEDTAHNPDTTSHSIYHSRLLSAIADLIESEPSKLGFAFPSGEIEIEKEMLIWDHNTSQALVGIDLIVRYRSNINKDYEITEPAKQ